VKINLANTVLISSFSVLQTMTILQDICPKLPCDDKKTILVNALLPYSSENHDDKNANPVFNYERKDIVIGDGKILAIFPSSSSTSFHDQDDAIETIDCSERMILPGFVNAHTHSSEQWEKGLIQQLPLELWVLQLIKNEPRGDAGWYGTESLTKTPSWAIAVSALQSGLEAMLSGCTAVMDHLFVRNIEDVEAAVSAYKCLGIRAFVAPMLNDDKEMYLNYVPLVTDAKERNVEGCTCALGTNGCYRVTQGPSDPVKTQEALDLWEESVKRFHDPDGGIEIVIAPYTPQSCSIDLLKGAVDLRKKYNLCGHTHLLETRGEALMAKQFFPSKSAVTQLRQVGFLDLPGTSCAHAVWLSEEEIDIMADAGAVVVHNPLSNLRLGSGVFPVKQALDRGLIVSIGCDGSCSSDGQNMLEAIKLATTLSTITTPEYRDWLQPQLIALSLASKNGYRGLNMAGKAGEIKVGMAADLTLWDLTSLALLPRTDPLSTLILGSRCQAPGDGSTLDIVYVNGRKVVSNGSPLGVDIQALRLALMEAKPTYRDPAITSPKADPMIARAEFEYRAAMGLDSEGKTLPTSPELGFFPDNRVLYDSTLK
jgi:5-methylthioadenosine/S-adenosylhomocysteine deaminase